MTLNLLILIAIFGCLGSVYCWWEAGHMIVNQIAKKDLLSSHHEKIYHTAEDLSYYGADMSLLYTYDFVYAAVWPDDINALGIEEFNCWHFMG